MSKVEQLMNEMLESRVDAATDKLINFLKANTNNKADFAIWGIALDTVSAAMRETVSEMVKEVQQSDPAGFALADAFARKLMH